MPHIALPDAAPGMRGVMAVRPDTARVLTDLAEELMRGPGTLTFAERELIATSVSAENACRYCEASHGAIAAHHLGHDETLVRQVTCDAEHAAIPEKLKALLAIARHTARGGACVTPDDIARARAHDATDLEIHDTVLIAAFFCLCNRYVDGLAAWTPDDPGFYRQRAAMVAEHGYAGR